MKPEEPRAPKLSQPQLEGTYFGIALMGATMVALQATAIRLEVVGVIFESLTMLLFVVFSVPLTSEEFPDEEFPDEEFPSLRLPCELVDDASDFVTTGQDSTVTQNQMSSPETIIAKTAAGTMCPPRMPFAALLAPAAVALSLLTEFCESPEDRDLSLLTEDLGQSLLPSPPSLVTAVTSSVETGTTRAGDFLVKTR